MSDLTHKTREIDNAFSAFGEISGLYCKLHGKVKMGLKDASHDRDCNERGIRTDRGFICFVPRGSGMLERKGVLNKQYSVMEISMTNLKTSGSACFQGSISQSTPICLKMSCQYCYSDFN